MLPGVGVAETSSCPAAEGSISSGKEESLFPNVQVAAKQGTNPNARELRKLCPGGEPREG